MSASQGCYINPDSTNCPSHCWRPKPIKERSHYSSHLISAGSSNLLTACLKAREHFYINKFTLALV